MIHFVSFYYLIQENWIITFEISLCLISTACSINVLLILMGMIEVKQQGAVRGIAEFLIEIMPNFFRIHFEFE
uniref:7TM_GPCR_Srx domain-containing protein n=1 Tax=Caenorhabditis tropicalis TaxID=1561998 RepID=A0A1I7URH6_9PELO